MTERENNMSKELNKDYLNREAVNESAEAEADKVETLSRSERRKARQKAEKKAQKEAAKEARRAEKEVGRTGRKASGRLESSEKEVSGVKKADNGKTEDRKIEQKSERRTEKNSEKSAEAVTHESSKNLSESAVTGAKPQNSKRRKKKKKKTNKVLVVILIILLVIGVASGTIFAMHKNGMLAIEKITVNGNKYYTDKYIVKSSKVKKGTDIFSIKKDDVEDQVRKLPYVKSVSVQRQLPHTLAISVVERAPEYAVYAGGYYIYLDKELYILAKSNESSGLRIIEGFVPEKLEMGEKFVTEDSDNFRLAIKLSKEMDKHGVKIFKISKRETILRVFLSENIVCEGSYENILANVSRVDAILKSLENQKINRATIYFGDNDYIAFSPRIE